MNFPMNLAGMAKLRMLRRLATSVGLETFYIMGGFGFTIILILVMVSSRSVNWFDWSIFFISLVITLFSFLVQTQSLRFFHNPFYCPGWFLAGTSGSELGITLLSQMTNFLMYKKENCFILVF